MITKVKHTVSYKTSQGDVIVTKGQLILIPNQDTYYEKSIHCLGKNKLEDKLQYGLVPFEFEFQAIIISKTDPPSFVDGLVLDCMIYDSYYKVIKDYTIGASGYKILALPENFTPGQLEAIVDGKMKDGDEMYVECEISQKINKETFIGGKNQIVEKIWKSESNNQFYFETNNGKDSWLCTYQIKLNSYSHVKLHKLEDKPITKDEMHLNMQYYMEYCGRRGYITPMEWLENHKHF